MDYKAQVMEKAEEKYRNMLSGNTEPLIRPEVEVADSSAYAQQRDSVYRRLAQESIAFDQAVDTVRRARSEREADNNRKVGQESLDKSRFAGVTWVTVLHILLMALFGYACIAWDLQQIAGEVALPLNADFFFGFIQGGRSRIPEWIEQVTQILAVGGTIAMIVIFHKNDNIEGCFSFVFFDIILAPICGVLAAIILRALIGVLSNVLWFLLQPYGALAIGLLSVILILIVGAGLESAQYKKKKWICALVCMAASVVAALIGFVA